jgi:hypothetical protein
MTLALASCLAAHAEAENRTPSGVKSAIETMPPQYLVQITRQAQRDSKGILWGEVHDGLVLGIGQIRTSWKSPIWPIIDVYLENRGREMVEGTLLVSSSYIVELDGQSRPSRCNTTARLYDGSATGLRNTNASSRSKGPAG